MSMHLMSEMPVLSLAPDFAFPQTNVATVVPHEAGSSWAASSSAGSSSARSFAAERKQLAPNFQPGPFDVICAR